MSLFYFEETKIILEIISNFFYVQILIIHIGEVRMRKYIFVMGIILLSLILVSIEPTYGLEEENQNFTFQNSNDLFDTILKERITNIAIVCSYDYCDSFHSSNVEKGIENYKKNYLDYLKTKTTEENAISTVLKGFPITKITFDEKR